MGSKAVLDQGRLVELRVARGLSQAELARRAGVPKSVICQMEGGTRFGSEKTWMLIAKAMEVAVGDFVTIRDASEASS